MSASNATLGPVAPEVAAAATSSINADCRNPSGCRLLASATTGAAALKSAGGGGASIPAIATRAPNDPQTWGAGEYGLGVSVVGAAKSASTQTRWGLGTDPTDDVAALNWLGLSATPAPIVDIAYASADPVLLGVRLVAPPTTAPGAYVGSIQLLLVPPS